MVGGMIYTSPQAQVQLQAGARISFSDWPRQTSPSGLAAREWRNRERYYGSGREDRREERWREERMAREHCYRILDPIERARCFDNMR